MSTLDFSKNFTLSQASRLTIVSLLLLSACERNQEVDVSGEWQIIEASNSYRATLDRVGNGPSTWQGRQFTTTSMKDRRWQGTWRQADNDSEGQFELLLSEDGTQAKGNWSYTPAGARKDTLARQEGGTWVWTRFLVKNKSQMIEKSKEDNGRDDVFIKQIQKMERSRDASERAKFVPKPSSEMQPNRDKSPSSKMESNEANKKDDLSPKLLR